MNKEKLIYVGYLWASITPYKWPKNVVKVWPTNMIDFEIYFTLFKPPFKPVKGFIETLPASLIPPMIRYVHPTN